MKLLLKRRHSVLFILTSCNSVRFAYIVTICDTLCNSGDQLFMSNSIGNYELVTAADAEVSSSVALHSARMSSPEFQK